MPRSVSQDHSEPFAHLVPSYVERIFDDAQAWAQRVLRDAESEIALIEERYRELLAVWIEHFPDDDEDIADRAYIGNDLRHLIEVGLQKAQDARKVIDSGETSLRAATA